MKEMKKDETIERTFREYFDGSEVLRVDLSQAKAEISRSPRKKGWGIFWKVAPALACFLIVCVASVGVVLGRGSMGGDMPTGEAPAGAQYYTLAEAQAEHSTYAQLSQQYGAALRGLSPFEWADNAQADYTLYAVDGENTLIGVRLRYLQGFLFWEGELYIDLTGGAYLPEELEPFADLPGGGAVAGRSYQYSEEYIGGEYVSEAKISLPTADYYMTVTGQNEGAAVFLLQLLAVNA